MLYNDVTIIIGLVYTSMLFMVMPLISVVESLDDSLIKAAYDLEAIGLITLRYLRPAIIGAAAVAFLMSFENFNTTMFLVGSEPTLPINLYLQVRNGSTPVINAISLLLISGISCLALCNFYFSKKED